MPRLDKRGQLWALCTRCGFLHPRNMLTPQLGLLVCHDHGCFDNLDNQYRPMLISNALATPEEADDNIAQYQNLDDPGELEL